MDDVHHAAPSSPQPPSPRPIIQPSVLAASPPSDPVAIPSVAVDADAAQLDRWIDEVTAERHHRLARVGARRFI
eukprot:scaffold285651_cov32-Tisochrysis_lutea.AAC.2